MVYLSVPTPHPKYSDSVGPNFARGGGWGRGGTPKSDHWAARRGQTSENEVGLLLGRMFLESELEFTLIARL